MKSVENIKQILNEYETAGLVDRDIEKVLSLLTDDVLGIGMGEQGLVTSKKDIIRIMEETYKANLDETYSLEISDIYIRLHEEKSANVCAKVLVKRVAGGETTTSCFMQSLYLIQENTSWRICGLHASPAYLTEESIDSFPMGFADSTLAQLRAELQQEALQLTNQNLSGGIFGTYVVSKQQHPLYFVNDSFLQMLGYQRTDFISRFQKNAADLIYPEDKHRVLQEIALSIEKGQDFETHYRMIKQNGDILWVIQHGKKTIGNEGQAIVLAVVTDITEMICLQQSLEKQAVLLEEQAEELTAQNKTLLEQRQSLEDQARVLAVSEERFRLALEKSSNVIFDYDIESGIIIHTSSERKTDYVTHISDAKNTLVADATILDDSMLELEDAFSKIEAGEPHVDCVVHVKRTDEKDAWKRISITGVANTQGRTLRAVGLIEDITRQTEAEIAYKREEQYRQVLFSSAMGVYVVNFTKGIFESSEIIDKRCIAIEDGASYDELIWRLAKTHMNEEDRFAFLDMFSKVHVMEAFEKGEQELTLEYNFLNANGKTMWVSTIIRLMEDNITNERKGFLYVMDIDKRKQEELALSALLERDPLTGLYNKAATERYIHQRLERADGITTGAFFMIDIDRFKEINDTFGHPYGDSILKQAAATLQANFRENDIIGRLGGDEFCVFLSGVSSPERVTEAAKGLCEKFFTLPIPQKKTGGISCSIGIAVCGGCPKTFAQIYQEADAALYTVKRNGRNGYAFYGQAKSQGPQIWLQNTEILLDEMQMAIYVSDRDSFDLIYINEYFLRYLKVDRRDCLGKKCYTVLCKRNTPCPFCSVEKLEKGKSLERIFQPLHSKHKLLLRGQLIDWNGRTAHLEIANEITDELLEQMH